MPKNQRFQGFEPILSILQSNGQSNGRSQKESIRHDSDGVEKLIDSSFFLTFLGLSVFGYRNMAIFRKIENAQKSTFSHYFTDNPTDSPRTILRQSDRNKTKQNNNKTYNNIYMLIFACAADKRMFFSANEVLKCKA